MNTTAKKRRQQTFSAGLTEAETYPRNLIFTIYINELNGARSRT